MQRTWVMVWAVIIAVILGGAEAVAVIDPAPGDTLSEWTRWLIAATPTIPLTEVHTGSVALIAVAVWFIWHILWQHRGRK